MTQTGEDIDEPPARRFRMKHAVRGNRAKAASLGQIEKIQSVPMALPREVALYLDERPLFAEKRDQRIDCGNVGRHGDKTRETFGYAKALTQAAGRWAFSHYPPGSRGKKPAEVAIPFLVFHQKGDHAVFIRRSRGQRNPRAHDGPDTGLLRGLEESGRTGKGIAIGKAHCLVTHPSGLGDKILGA